MDVPKNINDSGHYEDPGPRMILRGTRTKDPGKFRTRNPIERTQNYTGTQKLGLYREDRAHKVQSRPRIQNPIEKANKPIKKT